MFTILRPFRTTILHPFQTRKSIRRKADHGGQIVLTTGSMSQNLAKVTMFVVCMSSTRMLMWVRSRAKQKHSLTFCVFGQTRSKCFHHLPSPSRNPNKGFMRMARLSTHLTLPQVACCHNEIRPKLSTVEHSCCHTSSFHFHTTHIPLKHKYLIYRNPTLRECEDETHTPEMGTWESSETLESSEFDCKGQNISHWSIISLESYQNVDVENGLA
jgi:hypothetical protein